VKPRRRAQADAAWRKVQGDPAALGRAAMVVPEREDDHAGAFADHAHGCRTVPGVLAGVLRQGMCGRGFEAARPKLGGDNPVILQELNPVGHWRSPFLITIDPSSGRDMQSNRISSQRHMQPAHPTRAGFGWATPPVSPTMEQYSDIIPQ
jgi:hypothetical protein